MSNLCLLFWYCMVLDDNHRYLRCWIIDISRFAQKYDPIDQNQLLSKDMYLAKNWLIHLQQLLIKYSILLYHWKLYDLIMSKNHMIFSCFDILKDHKIWIQLQNHFGPVMQGSKTSLECLVRPRQDPGSRWGQVSC